MPSCALDDVSSNTVLLAVYVRQEQLQDKAVVSHDNVGVSVHTVQKCTFDFFARHVGRVHDSGMGMPTLLSEMEIPSLGVLRKLCA